MLVPGDVLAAAWDSFPGSSQLLEILTHPVSTDPPDLSHFVPPTAAAPSLDSAARSGQPGLAIWKGRVLAILLLTLLAILAVYVGGHGRMASTKAALLAALLPGSLAILIAGQAFGLRADPLSAIERSAPRVTAAPSASSIDIGREDSNAFRVRSDAQWSQLLEVEDNLTAQRHHLVQLEAITRRGVLDSLRDAEVGKEAQSLRSQDVTARVVSEHTGVQPIYSANLQAEYDIYRRAANDPALKASLIAHAAQLGPNVKRVVVDDLTLVALQSQQEALVNSGANATPVSAGLARLSGPTKFAVPVAGLVVQRFGRTGFALEPPMEYRGVFYPHFHTGIDIAALENTPIHDAADGVVTFVGRMTDGRGKLVGYGNFVTIAHPDGYLTLYAHLQSVAVRAGQLVHQGDVIGTVGSTGWSTGPHLHFEIRHDHEAQDPLPYLMGNAAS